MKQPLNIRIALSASKSAMEHHLENLSHTSSKLY